MNWKEKLKNLLSRKFLLALIGAASGLAPGEKRRAVFRRNEGIRAGGTRTDDET